MDLLQYFKTLNQPTKAQEEALVNLDKFLSSDNRCFALKGYAGTGKTFIIKGLCEYLNKEAVNFKLMAPTGRAAKVIRERTGYGAGTIHRSIYSLDELKSIEVRNKDNSVDIKYFFDIKVNEDLPNTIYIVDESSMVSNVYSEGEFFKFGTGYLLNDLLQYINIFSKNNKRKIIFIGDNAQLPPVGSNLSPALSEDYIKEKYEQQCLETELTEVVRQNSLSGILLNATKLREQIKAKEYNKVDIDTKPNDIEKISVSSLLERYLNITNNAIDASSVIIGYSNEKVYHYNKIIREHFFKGKSNITMGDLVMVVQNNYCYPVELFNGDFARIFWADESNEIRHIPLKEGKNQITVELVFRNVILIISDNKGKYYKLKCKILENILNSKERDITPEETRALYVDFLIRKRHLKPGSSQFKMEIRKDPYFNALKLKYGYAITCHKAQGGEWNNVFIDFNMGKNVLTEEFFRWSYTAITRAKQRLFTIDEPHISLTTGLADKISYSEPIISNSIDSKIDKAVEELAEKFNVTKDNPLLIGLLAAVYSRIKDKAIKIDEIAHFQYCERYYFEYKGKFSWVQFWYNKNNVISNFAVQPEVQEELRGKLQGLFQDLVKKEVRIKEQRTQNAELQDFDFEDKPKYLKEFYQQICERLSLINIQIEAISHHDYLEKYKFTKGNLYAAIDFNYNAKGQFTRVSPQAKKSNSEELMKEIIDVIKIVG